MRRRNFLQQTGLVTLGAGLLGATNSQAEPRSGPAPSGVPAGSHPIGLLAPVLARSDRIMAITVCSRPFRAQGPRVEAERVGSQWVVHNYGHGGSGWSLSWGSSALAVKLALESGDRDCAVIGCGALGLTSAILLRRAGKRVTIYAKDRPPQVPSAFATGVWSPDSRVCAQAHATPAYAKVWEEMCRTSYRMKQTFLGVTGDPVEWRHRYLVSEVPFAEFKKRRDAEDGPITFGKFPDRVKDLTPAVEDFPPSLHPFGAPFVRRTTTMFFNLSIYQRMLVNDFLAEGGRIEHREFHTPGDLASLPEKTIIHATGIGARALFSDETITPVRGQIALLIPQSEVNYGIVAEGVSMVARRDGIVVQANQSADFGNDSLIPDRAESERAIQVLAQLIFQMKPQRTTSGG